MKSKLKQRIGAVATGVALLGVIVSPVIASAASQSASTTINADVASVISISTGTTVNIALTPTPGGVVSSASDIVSVSTNNTPGYTLNIADSDATTTLTSGSNTFTAASGTKVAPIALTNGTWGFAVATATTGIGTNGFDASYSAETNAGSSTSKWAGIPASGSPMLLKSTTGTATSDTTTVWYAARASTSQANGTYTDTVTYTATTK